MAMQPLAKLLFTQPHTQRDENCVFEIYKPSMQCKKAATE